MERVSTGPLTPSVASIGRSAALLACALMLAACAGVGGLGSVARTAELRPGMSPAQVQALLGAPAATQRGEHGVIWKYSLHEYYKGWVSYYLLLAGEPAQLQQWVADEAEYQRNQQMWLQVLATMPAAQAGGGRASSGSGAQDCRRGSVEDRTACTMTELSR
jgi:hypothetical protein